MEYCVANDLQTFSFYVASLYIFHMYTQWGRGTVFQEDYFDLLNAAEIGMQITYNPSNAEALLKNFATLYSNAITEVYTHMHTYKQTHTIYC